MGLDGGAFVFAPFGVGCEELEGFGQEGGGAGFLHFVAPAFAQGCSGGRVVVVDGFGEFSDMFAGVVEVEDLDGVGEGLTGVFPNPRGAVSEEGDAFGVLEVAAEGFLMEEDGEVAAAFEGADIAGGVGIAQGCALGVAQGVALGVEVGLGEDAAEFGLAGFWYAVWVFGFAVVEFGLAHGGACAVAGDIEHIGRGLGLWRLAQGAQDVAQLGGRGG